ncbi:uncharacterized protein LAESUDRAFT_759987 [Laetiporus sulphureus 93-53]|uniref:Uncharacterized protein n=1 Tax=Laetiporus sulphureus 93-53 TaxID=1314785 RepID=A0A165DW74_9APHY|nr:uncharacterized protein LAESUDRAFT_759987 [Laetiporus sulphureus 93-53]KZT05754.1 hypothetical protein LAESUDRAFT_759987 [Laetiporus sulphureus 93-53]
MSDLDFCRPPDKDPRQGYPERSRGGLKELSRLPTGDYVEPKLFPVLISRVLLNVRAAARFTHGEQSQTPSFIRSRQGVQTQADVENMSFELNILSSSERAPESDRFDVQDSIEHDQLIAESLSMADGVLTVGDAHQNVNEEETMDDADDEMLSDWEDDE